MKKVFLVVFLLCCVCGFANATTVFNQNFDTDTAGWFSYNSLVTQGSNHALVSDTASDYTGAFTRFDGYRNIWTGGFTAYLYIFLDTSWAAGSGFDYSVAANGSDGNHQRDYIFHVSKDTSTNSLLVGGSNNSNFETREDLEGINHYNVVTSGWYTFKHVFYEDNGLLAVDLILLDANGHELFTETRSSASDIISSEIGGNRYGWLTFVDVEGGLAIDNSRLDVIPEPATMLLFGLGLLGVAGIGRRKK